MSHMTRVINFHCTNSCAPSARFYLGHPPGQLATWPAVGTARPAVRQRKVSVAARYRWRAPSLEDVTATQPDCQLSRCDIHQARTDKIYPIKFICCAADDDGVESGGVACREM